MQIASYGLRGLPGQAASRWLSTGAPPTRGIHLSSIPRTTQTSSSGFAHKLLSKGRSFLTGFVGHLTTPGVGHIPAPARSLHTARPQTIHQRLSLPSRYALSNAPLHAPRLPKPPMVPRSTMQVGLGVARNFSTARPIFQNLVQNVPVAGRAFYEADWEIKMPEIEKGKTTIGKENEEVKKGKEMLKATERKAKKEKVRKEAPSQEQEYEHYFPTPVVADVTTYLYVPLAPTPTTRMPLQSSGLPSRLLPLSSLASLHNSHHTHSLRVSSLFMRLDQAKVWERGAMCSAYGDPSGVCAVLKVEFRGWTEGMVRGIIGESGSGWCEIEEVRFGEEEERDSLLEDMSSVTSEVESEVEHQDLAHGHEEMRIDPAQSFVLPTLDFSSSFYAVSRQSVAPPFTPLSSGISTPTSDIHLSLSDHNERFSDFSFSDSGSEHSFSSGSVVDAPSLGGSSWYDGIGFSSEFSGRIEDREPREAMF